MNTVKMLLESGPPGAIGNGSGLDRLLAACWGDLEGAKEVGMAGDKLLGRMESIRWKPPILSFVTYAFRPEPFPGTLGNDEDQSDQETV